MGTARERGVSDRRSRSRAGDRRGPSLGRRVVRLDRGEAGRQLQGVAAPLLVTARSDEPGLQRLAGLLGSADHVITLSGMSLAETTRLAELAAPGTGVDGSGLWERTGGVPSSSARVPSWRPRAAGRRSQPACSGAGSTGSARRPAGCSRPWAIAPPEEPRCPFSPGRWGAGGRELWGSPSTWAGPRIWWSTSPEAGCGSGTCLLTEAAADRVPAAERRTLRLALADCARRRRHRQRSRPHAARQRLLALPVGDTAGAAAAALEAVVALRAAEEGSGGIRPGRYRDRRADEVRRRA